MPYLHDKALVDAYKKLYMLGGKASGRRKQAKSDFEQASAGAMSGISKAYVDKRERDRQAADQLRKQLEAKRAGEAADQAQMDDDVRYIKEGPEAFHEFQQVRSGNAVPTNPYAAELAKQNADREAAQTQIGGVYTPQGLQTAEKEATLNAQDRLMMRSMIPGPAGLGGSNPVPMQPPNAMDRYRYPQ